MERKHLKDDGHGVDLVQAKPLHDQALARGSIRTDARRECDPPAACEGVHCVGNVRSPGERGDVQHELGRAEHLGHGLALLLPAGPGAVRAERGVQVCEHAKERDKDRHPPGSMRERGRGSGKGRVGLPRRRVQSIMVYYAEIHPYSKTVGVHPSDGWPHGSDGHAKVHGAHVPLLVGLYKLIVVGPERDVVRGAGLGAHQAQDGAGALLSAHRGSGLVQFLWGGHGR